jgi:L-methionine (R)-S-oxide reductase
MLAAPDIAGSLARCLARRNRAVGAADVLKNRLDFGRAARHTGRMAVSENIDAARVSQSLERALFASAQPQYDDALRAVADAFGAVSATLHRADRDNRLLHMLAYLGLPPALVPITQRIPFGKGIAGLCAERCEPITLCNLQTDASGAARPDAKLTGVAGAISVPILAADGSLLGTLGIGKPNEHTYTDEEQRILGEFAGLIGRTIKA